MSQLIVDNYVTGDLAGICQFIPRNILDGSCLGCFLYVRAQPLMIWGGEGEGNREKNLRPFAKKKISKAILQEKKMSTTLLRGIFFFLRGFLGEKKLICIFPPHPPPQDH